MKNRYYSEKNKKCQEQASPMLASVNWNLEDDTDQDLNNWFTEFQKLEIVIRFGLLSEKVKDEVLNIAKKYNIEDRERIGEISRIIREVFTRQIKEEDIKRRVIEKLKISELDVSDFMNDLKKILVLVKKEGQRIKKEDEEQDKKENKIIAIVPAMETYKEIGEQLISSEPIKLEIFDEPVRPSIKNWIEDYRETMGLEKASIKISSYLFTSENAKELDPEERKKVALILKSYNNNIELVVNSKEKLVDFERSLALDNKNKSENQKGLRGEDEKDDLFIDNKTFSNRDTVSKLISDEDKKQISNIEWNSGKQNGENDGSYKTKYSKKKSDNDTIKNLLDLSEHKN